MVEKCFFPGNEDELFKLRQQVLLASTGEEAFNLIRTTLGSGNYGGINSDVPEVLKRYHDEKRRAYRGGQKAGDIGVEIGGRFGRLLRETADWIYRDPFDRNF